MPQKKPEWKAPPFIRFPLPGGNLFEMRLRFPVSAGDFETIKEVIELSRTGFVREAPAVQTSSAGEIDCGGCSPDVAYRPPPRAEDIADAVLEQIGQDPETARPQPGDSTP